MTEFINVEIAESVATVYLQRPPMNALNRAMQGEIRDAAREMSERADVRAVVFYGGPKVFAAGADVKEMADWSYPDAAAQTADLTDCFTAVARIPKPTIAAVTGYALGGGLELALCCDLRICGDNARMGQPEILLGIIPGAGGTQRLPRLIGPAKAKELIFTGRMVDADEAAAVGLVNRVVAPDEVYSAALELAHRLAAGPPLALRAAKEAVDRGLEVDLATGLEIERLQFTSLFATQDQADGMRSFVEHGPGKAEFTGR